MTIAIIGAGNMGSALCQAFIRGKIVAPKNLILADPSEDVLRVLKKKLNIKIAPSNTKAAQSDVLIIAVKPQNFADLAEEIKGTIPKKSMVISIMAGVSLKKMITLLNHDKIVRSMPNTPALVGEGVIGWYATKALNAREKKQVQHLFTSLGYAFEVKKESLLSDLTALSGCGPGFFLYLLDQWFRAAETLRFPRKETEVLLGRTIHGALKLLETSGESPEQLVQKVASKGGATEQGLKILQQAHLKKIFAKMLKAAYNRCKQLG